MLHWLPVKDKNWLPVKDKTWLPVKTRVKLMSCDPLMGGVSIISEAFKFTGSLEYIRVLCIPVSNQVDYQYFQQPKDS